MKSCYNPLRLGTVIVLICSGIDFVNTPRLYSDRAIHIERLQIWPFGVYLELSTFFASRREKQNGRLINAWPKFILLLLIFAYSYLCHIPLPT